MIRLVLILVFAAATTVSAETALFGVSRSATPVLNIADLHSVLGGKDGRTLKRDRCGQVRELEFIALPGTVFRIVSKATQGATVVYQVETDEYPVTSTKKLYLDARFLDVTTVAPSPRRPALPSVQTIVATLKKASGSPYVWGGNLKGGVPELLPMYYHDHDNVTGESDRLSLAGVDCSGLLYEATNGWTPRNTSQLVSFGSAVTIAGNSIHQIAAALKPLDLIVWNGHVLIVLDKSSIIESRLACDQPGNGGVIISPLKQRLAEIMKTRRPADIWPAGHSRQALFVVRRWY